MEPMNSVYKCTVAAVGGGNVVGYLKKGTSGKFVKTVFNFLKCDENNRQMLG